MGISKENLEIKQIKHLKEDHQHLGTAFFVKPTYMIQDSAGSLGTQPNTKQNNVKSTTHAICASRQVNTRQIRVHVS